MQWQPTPTLLTYFNDYEESHQTPGNRATHWVGLPTVMFSLLGLFGHVVLWNPMPESIFRLDLAIFLLLWGFIWCVKTDYKIGGPFILFSIMMYLWAREISLPILSGIQIGGWVFQLAGHAIYEKKRPKFLENITHLFVGPMWKFAHVIGYYKPAKHG